MEGQSIVTKNKYQAIKAHINNYFSDDELREMMTDKTGRDLIEDGNFACYYSDIWGAMIKWYGDKWDDSKYIAPRATGLYWNTVDGVDYHLKMRGWVPLLWWVYVNKVASVLERIRREND